MGPSSTATTSSCARRRAVTTAAGTLLIILLLFGIALALPRIANAAAGSINGWIADPGATAIAGIDVTVWAPDGSGGWTEAGSAVSDSAGRYSVAGLGSGTYRVEFSDADGAWRLQYYDDREAGTWPSPATGDPVVLTSGMVTGIDACMVTGGSLTGTVTKAGGGGLAGIQVYAFKDVGGGIWQSVRATTTAFDGSYAMRGMYYGTFRVEFTDPAGAYQDQWYDHQLFSSTGDDVVVPPGGTRSGVDGELAEAGRVGGGVTGGGHGLGGITVSFYQPDGAGDWYAAYSVETGADGSYLATQLPVGDYRVGFSDPSGQWAPQFYRGRASLDDGDRVSVTFGATTSGIDAVLLSAGRVTGTVTDLQGTGLPGIVAFLWQSDGSGGWSGHWSATTDALGVYRVDGLAAGVYRVTFWDPAHVYASQCYLYRPSLRLGDDVTVTAGATTAGIDAVLGLPQHISGRVKSSHNEPLAGIRVSALKPDAEAPGGWSVAGSAFTATDGTYDIADLAPGSYRVGFGDGSGTYLEQYYSSCPTIEGANDVIVYSGAATVGIDAALGLAGHISGVVARLGGGAAAGITVTAHRGSSDVVAVTAADGSYDIGGLPAGTYTVRFTDDSGTYLAQYYSGRPPTDEGLADPVSVTAGATTPGINAVLAPAGHVTGTVKDVAGTGLGLIRVIAYEPDGSGGWRQAGTAVTSGGAYDVGGLSTGAYRIYFLDVSRDRVSEYYDDKATLEEADDVAVTAGSTTSGIDAVLTQSGDIDGKVTDAGSVPLQGIGVAVFRPSGLRPSGAPDWKLFETTMTGVDGHYAFIGLPPGTYRVKFRDDTGLGQYATQYWHGAATVYTADDVVVTPGGTAQGIDAVMMAPGGIGGTVKDESSAPVAGIEVSAWLSTGDGWFNSAAFRTLTAADGTYAIGGLPPGPCRVQFRDLGTPGMYELQCWNGRPSLWLADDVLVTSGATTSGVDAVLLPVGHVAGRVQDEGNAPLAGIGVALFRYDPSGVWVIHATTATGADGAYGFSDVRAGTYRVKFRDDAGVYTTQFWSAKDTIGDAGDVLVSGGVTTSGIDATLRADPGRITGTVTGGGAPLARVTAVAYRADASGSWTAVESTQSVAGGTYELRGLPAGAYRLEFYDSARAYVMQFYSGRSSIELADDVGVSAGATTSGIDVDLVAKGVITGTVTNSKSSSLPGIGVAAFTADGAGGWRLVTGTGTAADGSYGMRVPPGTYRVKFRDDTGAYATQFYDAGATIGSAADVVVVAGVRTTGIDAVLQIDPGRIAGTVTAGGTPAAGVWVEACGPDGGGTWSSVDSTKTAADGTYTLQGLAPGAYRVRFEGGGAYATLYYDAAATVEAADDVLVTAGATARHVDASLVPDNTPAGPDQTVSLPSGVTLTFDEVDTPGLTTVTVSTHDPGTTPAPFRVLGGYFYQIATSAGFTGPVTVALPYDPTGLTLAQQLALTIMHYENGVWTNVTTSVDTTACIVYGSVSTLSPFALAVDTTPPLITITAPAAGAAYAQGQAATADWTAGDDASGIDWDETSATPLDTTTPGIHTFTVTATDRAGNVSQASVLYTVYATTGIAPPVDANGASVFKAGSTVPLKFRLAAANGVPVTGLSPKGYVAMLTNGVPGPWRAAVSTSAADKGNTFRETGSGTYLFDLSTKGLAPGVWRVRIDIGAGAQLFAQFRLK